MDTIWIIVAMVIAGALITLLSQQMKISSLKENFGALGKLPGRSRAEIVERVGEPNVINTAGAGQLVLTWHAASNTESYTIALLFEDDVCAGILNETATAA